MIRFFRPGTTREEMRRVLEEDRRRTRRVMVFCLSLWALALVGMAAALAARWLGLL